MVSPEIVIAIMKLYKNTNAKMSTWKPILNQAHFDRKHKTQPHQEKVL